MATVRELQSKAKKALKRWKKELAPVLKKDQRSPVGWMCLAILMRNNTITNARQAEDKLKEHFADWNEIRVTALAELTEVLEEASVPNARTKAAALKRFLEDVFLKFTKTNFNWELIIVPEVKPEPEAKPVDPNEIVEIDLDDDDDEDDEDETDIVSRETGLPKHPTIPGFIDMEIVIDQPEPLEPKVIIEKNSKQVCFVVWDEPDRAPFHAMWANALVEGFVEPELSVYEAAGRMRQITPDDKAEFAFYAVVDAVNNWPKLASAASKIQKKAAKAAAKA